MADSIQLHLEIQNSLNKTLKEAQLVMKSFNDNLTQSAKKFEGLDKTATSVEDHYDDIEKSSKKIVSHTGAWSKSLTTLRSIATSLAAPIAAIYPTALMTTAVKTAFQYDDVMKDVSFRMGDAGKSAQTLKNAMYGTAKATGITVEQSAELVKGLKQFRVANKDLLALSTNTARFSEITGVTADASTRLAGELIRTGRLGEKATSGILSGMVKVQRAVGMTEAEMQTLTEGIIYSTRMLQQMGKSAGQIEGFTQGVTKLAAGFAQVGIDASKANEFITALLDPGRIEDNALLYAKLGVSMEDVLSGNVDPGMLAGKFKDLGSEIKAMSGPAAAAMSKALGMSLGDLRQMADMDLSQLEKTFAGGGDAAGDMAKAQDEQLSVQDRMQKTMNRVQTTMSQFVDKTIPALEKGFKGIAGFLQKHWKKILVGGAIALLLFLPILRKKFKTVTTEISKDFHDGIVGAVDMASTKAGIIMKRRATAPSARGIDREARIKAGPGFAQTQAQADIFDTMAQGNLFPAVKRLTENTSVWLRQISTSARPLSKLNVLANENNKVILDRIQMAENERSINKESFSDQKESLGFQMKAYSDRLDQLSEYAKNHKLTGEQLREQEMLRKEIIKLGNKSTTIGDKIAKNEERFNDLTDKYIKSLGPEAAAQLIKKSKINAKIAGDQLASSKQALKDLGVQKELLTKELKIKEELLQSGKGSYLEIKKLKEEQAYLNNLIEEENNKRSESLNTMAKERGEMLRIAKAREKTVGEVAIETPEMRSPLRRFTRLFTTGIGKMSSGMINAGDKFKNSMKVVGENLKERLNPKNWGKALKSGVKEGSGGLLKGLGALSIPMIALSLVMKFIQPILEKLKPVFETLMGAISGVVEKIAPVFMKLFAKMLPLIVMLINKLLPSVVWLLGQAVKVIGWLTEGMGKLLKAIMEMPTRLKVIFDTLMGDDRKEAIAAGMEEAKKSGLTGRDLKRLALSIGRQQMVDEELSKKSPGFKKAMDVFDKVEAFGVEVQGFGNDIIDISKDLMKNPIITDTMMKDMQKKLLQAAGGASVTGAATAGAGSTPAEYRATQTGLVKIKDAEIRKATVEERTEEHTEKVAEDTEKVKDNTEVLVEETRETNSLIRGLVSEMKAQNVNNSRVGNLKPLSSFAAGRR